MLSVGGMFDGAGLLALGLHQAGLRHAWLCEADEWRRGLLERRFGVPVFDDVRAVGASAVRVDVIAGGFPCKGASSAGKREGFGHPETVLWREMARAVRELRPRYVVVENVANILGLHDGDVWGEVVGTLAALGYDVEWDVLPAAAVGAPHLRERVFAVATHAGSTGLEGRRDEGSAPDHAGFAADADGARRAFGRKPERAEQERSGHVAHEDPAGAHDASDPDGGRQPQQPERDREQREGEHREPRNDAERGVRVEWGRYAAAVARWEAIHGLAPEPLVRRLDDGDREMQRLRARVDRSRLSALGDGVHVYIGRLIGARLIELEQERRKWNTERGVAA